MTELSDSPRSIQAHNLQAASVDGLTPSEVLYPGSYEEAADILRSANDAGHKLVVRGGGTKLSLGNPVAGLDTVVSTAKLNRILEYPPADLVVMVQSGHNLQALQDELEKNGHFLPIDSPLSTSATIGGAIATNSSGPARLQYGPARDWLIGVRFALPDGTIAHGGGRVVKNVAGYDLMKLYIGSLGTLGMILDMNFKLMPIPAASSTLVITFAGEKSACDASLKIIDKGLFPTALTVLDERGAAAIGLPNKITLLAEVRNTRQAVERQVRDISELCQLEGAAVVERISEREGQKALWRKVTDFGYRSTLPPISLTLKAGILPTETATVIEQARALAKLYNLEIEVAAHAAHGITYITAKYDDTDIDTEGYAVDFVHRLTERVQSRRGSVTTERAPLHLRRRLGDVWGNTLTGGELKLMRGIKDTLDPKHILSPGRFVDGI